MDSLVLAAVVVLAVALLINAVRMGGTGARDKRAERWPYRAAKPLTQPEQVLYFRLVSALPERIILAQVQLSRMLRVEGKSGRQGWRNRIDRKSIDYVICARDASILAAIELDDRSHDTPDRRYADEVKRRALEAAGSALHRFRVESIPSSDELHALFVADFGRSQGDVRVSERRD